MMYNCIVFFSMLFYALFVNYIYKKHYSKKVYHVHEAKWFDINETLIPKKDLKSPSEKIFITDGEYVECVWYLTYNEEGKIILNNHHDEKIVTHWHPIPKPPGKK